MREARDVELSLKDQLRDKEDIARLQTMVSAASSFFFRGGRRQSPARRWALGAACLQGPGRGRSTLPCVAPLEVQNPEDRALHRLDREPPGGGVCV